MGIQEMAICCDVQKLLLLRINEIAICYSFRERQDYGKPKKSRVVVCWRIGCNNSFTASFFTFWILLLAKLAFSISTTYESFTKLYSKLEQLI